MGNSRLGRKSRPFPLACGRWLGTEGEVAGTVLNFIHEEENREYGRKRGYTETICVRRPFRRRGLARALIARSFQVLKDSGNGRGGLGCGCAKSQSRPSALQKYGLPACPTPHNLSQAHGLNGLQNFARLGPCPLGIQRVAGPSCFQVLGQKRSRVCEDCAKTLGLGRPVRCPPYLSSRKPTRRPCVPVDSCVDSAS